MSGAHHAGWERVPLGEVCRLQGGYAFKSAAFTAHGVPIVRMSNMKETGLDLTGAVCYPEELLAGLDRFLLRPGDLLLGMSGSIGFSAQVTEAHTPSLLNQRVGRLLVDPSRLSVDYLAQLVKSSRFQKTLHTLASGGAPANLSAKDVENMLIDLPPLPEQERIAEILGTVDLALAKTDAIIAGTQEVKLGTLDRLLQQGIGHERFQQTELGELPAAWQAVPLGEVCRVNPSYRLAKGQTYPYLEMAALDTTLPEIHYLLEREVTAPGGTRFQPGDVLFARITPCTENGKIGLVPDLPGGVGFGSTEFIVLSPMRELLLPEFLYYTVRSDRVRQYAISRMSGTTGRQRVPGEVFKEELLIALPPVSEQQRIGEILRSLDRKIAAEQTSRRGLLELKAALADLLLRPKS
ncbi:type I restriction enzyme S subunit [Tumebacillus sp. BK434]|uniref:restriction endonuclease subunit S n=1 Tax=Tumebacillus sp. BK434 TaxID=2512169 RepID=UPI0010523C60|nr:restriction endonuclease subunit S [Tumebacillus sp. BK434]TCP59114.1 type I restriction enzyme S subunit [Tumebacillus sp. BK434]